MLSCSQLPTPFPAPFGSVRRFGASPSSLGGASSPNGNKVLRLVGDERNCAAIDVGRLRRSSLPASPASLLVEAAGRRPFPTSRELWFLSLLFVLSMAIGSLLSLVVVSIPTVNVLYCGLLNERPQSLRKMAISMESLRRVVSEEVPGTLSSLKLSGLEINELTQQLSSLRLRISGRKHGNDGGNKRTRKEGIE